MSLVHLVSSAVLLVHCQQHTMGSVSSLWPAIFFPGGFILMFVVGMLIAIRRGERTHYEFVDKAAVVVAAVAIAVFVTIVRDIATSPNKAGAGNGAATSSLQVRSLGRAVPDQRR